MLPIAVSCLLAGTLALGAGCASRPASADAFARRQQLLRVLEREMRSNTGWVRVHAADALLDHGCTNAVEPLFAPEADTAPPPYRIGVWRVLARAAAGQDQRQAFVERIHRTMLDPQAPDRVHAAESLAKLGVAKPADQPVLVEWLATADDAASVYPLWLLVLSGSNYGQTSSEARLAELLDSKDSTARLRAAFALGRTRTISPDSVARLHRRLQAEPQASPTRPYVAAALLRHTAPASANAASIKREVAAGLVHGTPAEQLECAVALGLCGTAEDLRLLAPLMQSPEPDARIGAAGGSLYLTRAGEIVFSDDFHGKLADGWSWVREHPGAWRLSQHGLEVRIEPGNMWGSQNNARNVLVRPAPDVKDSQVEVSIGVQNQPTHQYEQVDLVWYYDDRNMVKLGQELVDGSLSVVMGREEGDKTRTVKIVPLTSTNITLRLLVKGNSIRGQFRTPTASDWLDVGECDLPAPKGAAARISLQFYQGPPEAEHWARVTRFRIARD